MEYRAEFAITLPEDLLNALGIDEDTLFEAYYDDGKIKVRILDEEALEDEFEDDDEDLLSGNNRRWLCSHIRNCG